MKTASTVAAALAVALLLPLGTTLAADQTATKPAEQATTTSVDANDAPKKVSPAKASDHRCTATRIRKDKAADCEKTAAPTRTYTQEEIQQTGETDIGQALRKLDPRFN